MSSNLLILLQEKKEPWQLVSLVVRGYSSPKSKMSQEQMYDHKMLHISTLAANMVNLSHSFALIPF